MRQVFAPVRLARGRKAASNPRKRSDSLLLMEKLVAICDEFERNGVRPSIRKAAAAGIGHSTLLRSPYKEVLKAARARHDEKHPATPELKKKVPEAAEVLFDPTDFAAAFAGDDPLTLKVQWLEAELKRRDLQIAKHVEAADKREKKLAWYRARLKRLGEEVDMSPENSIARRPALYLVKATEDEERGQSEAG